MKAGSMTWVRADSENQPHVGNAYLLRGFIGVFSEGIDNLTAKINAQGIRAHVYQDDQWSTLAKTLRETYRKQPNAEPLVLIGHSYGADDVLRVARELKKDNIPVALVVTLDAVTPIDVPSNVKRCVNIYQSNGVWDTMPWLRGVPVKPESTTTTELANYNIRVDRTDLLEPGTDHFNIEKKAKVHDEVVKQVLAACPTREQWSMTRGSPTVSTPAIPASSSRNLSTSGTLSPAAGQRADGRALSTH